MSATAAPALVRAGDPGWDDARSAWNRTVDQRPAAVMFATCAEDVAAAVSFAADRGLRVALQSTGHGARAQAPLDGALLVRTTGLGELAIDPQRRTARVGAGVVWAELQRAAGRFGLAGLAGTAGHVGVTGYALGGGLGWLARAHGLACRSVVGADVVTADGRLWSVCSDDDDGLLEALRSGAGGLPFAVTALELALVEAAEVQAGVLRWPADRAGEVLAAWRAWTDGVPDATTSLARVVSPPGADASVVVELCHLGTAREAAAVVAPLLRELPGFAGGLEPMAPARLDELHRDPVAPAPAAGAGALLCDAPAECLDGLLAARGSCPAIVSMEIRHLGGALAPQLDGRFLVYAVAIAAGPDAGRATDGLARVRDAAAPWASPQCYANFAAGRAELLSGRAPAAKTLLAAVESRVDPAGLFRASVRNESA